MTPDRWKKSRMIFVNSMSDLFHEEVNNDYIFDVFKTMQRANLHRYQVLTKRSSKLKEMDNKLAWTNNIWMGVSVENEDYAYRIDNLRDTNAAVKFLSLEPLLGPIPKMNLSDTLNSAPRLTYCFSTL